MGVKLGGGVRPRWKIEGGEARGAWLPPEQQGSGCWLGTKKEGENGRDKEGKKKKKKKKKDKGRKLRLNSLCPVKRAAGKKKKLGGTLAGCILRPGRGEKRGCPEMPYCAACCKYMDSTWPGPGFPTKPASGKGVQPRLAAQRPRSPTCTSASVEEH